jgi:KDO2-lipid IV(A) lauroyltransferase
MKLLLFALFVLVEKIIPLFPLKFLYAIVKIKANFFYYFLPIRKKVAYKNLKIAFREKTKKEINSIIKKCYLNVLIVIVEFFYMRKLNPTELSKKFVISNESEMNEKLKYGKGFIFVGAHFANWELMAYSGAKIFKAVVNVIVKEQSNKLLDKRLNAIREASGNRMIEMKKAPREILKALARNEITAMLGDQSAPQESVTINFFGKETPAFEGPAAFTLKTGTPLFFGVPFRDDEYNYTMKAIEINTSVYGSYSNENVKALTQEIMSLLEEHILMKPDHWLWFHKRFKSNISYD